MMDQPSHIHFVGIGGIGMSALAQLAQARGAAVSGSDLNCDLAGNPALARLAARGASLYAGHHAAHLPACAELVVVTAAAHSDNPEVLEARRLSVPIVSRAEMLGRLMTAHPGPTVAIAGTHGKTTTTALLGVILQECGADPTVLVGGEAAQLGGNLRIGSPAGPFVAEACEAYDSFLHLAPDIAVITNIEADHLDHYGTAERLADGFIAFAARVKPGDGKLVACLDDAGARSLGERLAPGARHVWYGICSAGAQERAEQITGGDRLQFLWRGDGTNTAVSLRLCGRHNALNALAALTAASLCGVPRQQAASAAAVFTGAQRRMETLHPGGAAGVTVLDDYAHHPTEIRATLNAVRSAYPGGSIVAVFQPHLYSRTRDFLDEFGAALSTVDALVLADIYPARELPIPGITSEAIAAAARRHRPGMEALYVPDRDAIPGLVRRLARPGGVALFLGAGDIRREAEILTELLQREEQP